MVPARLWIHDILQCIRRKGRAMNASGFTPCWPGPFLADLVSRLRCGLASSRGASPAVAGVLPVSGPARGEGPQADPLAQLPCCSPRWPCLGTSETVKLQGKAWPAFAGQLNNVSSGSAIYPPCSQRSQVLFILQVLPLFWGLNMWGLFIRLYCNTWYLFEFTLLIWISDLASSLSVFV